MKQRALRAGDYVEVTWGPWIGRRGFIQYIARANRYYRRRANVQFSAGLSGIVPTEWLTTAEVSA